jgi:diguanylate cyclase (GGDEF)-like protein
VGDAVLRAFGQQIRNTLRKVDLVFRYGGEEFVILLPRLDRESAMRAAERLRDAIAEHRFTTDRNGEILQVTASFGGALYPHDALSESGLFKAADEACYRAKSTGKNRVVFAGDDS